MKLLHRYNILVAALVYIVLFLFFLPVYSKVFDVDGVGYSMVAQQLAKGNFDRAINGFWSPLHSWIIAPFIQTGIPVQLLFFYSNALISLILLIQLRKLCNALLIKEEECTAILFTAVIVLLQFSFFELAADILVLPFLMGYLLLILRTDFYNNTKIQAWCGLIVGLAYLSKTYALPLVILVHVSLFVIHYVKEKKIQVKPLSAFFLLLFIIISPWIYIISSKYGYFTLGNSSRLNLSWFLLPNSSEYGLFQLPRYSDSPGWWEDPSYFKGKVVNMFTSTEMFIKQIRVFFYNITLYLKTLMEISAFAPAILLGALLYFFKKEETVISKLLVFLFIFPLGYLFTFVEARYLWIYYLLMLPLGWVMMSRALHLFKLNDKVSKFIFLIYCFSFLLQPVNVLKDNAYSAQWNEIQELSAIFKKRNIKGNFTANKNSSQAQVVAYLSGSRFYHLSTIQISFNELANGMENFQIPHLLYYYNTLLEKEAIISFLLQKNYQVNELKPGVLLFSVDKM